MEIYKKKYNPDDDLDVEFMKSHKLWELSQSGDFITPRPLEINYEAGTIAFEFMVYDFSIKNVYLNFMGNGTIDGDTSKLIKNAAEILGKIHQGLSLDSQRLWEVPEYFARTITALNISHFEQFVNDSPKACLHCDYGFSNLFYKKINGSLKIVVFDCSPNYHSTFYPNTYGPILVDIAIFFSCLEGRIQIWQYPLIKWKRLNKIKELFLRSYQETTGISIDQKWADLFGYMESRCYLFMEKNIISAWLAMTLLYNWWKSNTIKQERYLR